MGRVEQDVTYENHNMSPEEFQYLLFTWTKLRFLISIGVSTCTGYVELSQISLWFTKESLPDTLSWREKLGFNEKYVEYYLRHPAYRDYPVVGVSWQQASEFCKWRTDRVNEFILIREGILVSNPNQQNEPFTTDAYMAGQYEQGLNPQGQIADLDPALGWL